MSYGATYRLIAAAVLCDAAVVPSDARTTVSVRGAYTSLGFAWLARALPS